MCVCVKGLIEEGVGASATFSCQLQEDSSDLNGQKID